jgi:hypothetical protein
MASSAGMAAEGAYYLPLGDGWFEATAHTVGPWGPGHQHGGPPTALLAREIERLPGPDLALVTRLTCEILRPIPVGRIRVGARAVRPGRNVQLAEAELTDGDGPVILARAWRMATAPTTPPPGATPPAVPGPPPPEPDAEPTSAPATWGDGYLRSIDWHFAEGGFSPGPAVVWARQRLVLVAGEPPTPLQRLLTLADSGSGVGAVLDPVNWTFLNTELSVHLYRPPEGEWFRLDAATTVGGHGVGLASTRLSDRHGQVGTCAQSLLVRRR